MSRPSPGDLNLDGDLNTADVDLFCQQLAQPQPDPTLDLNRDQQVTIDDFVHLIDRLLPTVRGDANFDGRFDSTDLVMIFQEGRFESADQGAQWSQGDWNCDGKFDTADLVAALQSGSYRSDSLSPRPSRPTSHLRPISVQ